MSRQSLHQFYFDAIFRARRTRERYGQAMFNHLNTVRPELAEQVRGTEMDPMHVISLSDPRWVKFVEFVESNWHFVEHFDSAESPCRKGTCRHEECGTA